MKKIEIKSREHKILADTITPVGIYLKLRDRFASSFLLESSDYHGAENGFSYICCDPIAFIRINGDKLERQLPGGSLQHTSYMDVTKSLQDFVESFHAKENNESYIRSGLFGYINYDAVADFGHANLQHTDASTPLAQYHLFRFVIAFDHFRNECHLIESYIDQPDDPLFEEVVSLVQNLNIPSYSFRTCGVMTSNKTDEAFEEMVKKGIHHCQVGDVFQVVMSRNFTVPFRGDDFQVYRTLRSVNPSPYLFYFDYGSFRLFGSSPEAQLVLKEGVAEIHPIAGTFRRTGNEKTDAELAQQLINDPKEDAEHVMLVDLARNDLSRSCDDVKVETYKEVQYYSHVIHLVSKVTGKIRDRSSFMDIVAETFPAGTLSGAPKIRAMEIIAENEQTPRGFYGGAVGFMDFNGNFNHAIMIRSFKSHNNELKFQAGAGVVSQSTPDGELKEVYNKVGALQDAIKRAEEI
ncbi:MAG: anthranilate synthase component I family protein [Ekhidna sp.]